MLQAKKKYCFFILISITLVSCFLVCFKVVHAESQSSIERALNAYFLQRESEFMIAERSMLQTDVEENGLITLQEIDRVNFIDHWVDELNIEIQNSRIEYRIEDILEDNDEQLKILVYEWVWIDYICNGDTEENVENMGFGTHHILEFINNGDLVSDSYIEITGYETGTTENLCFLRAMNTETTDFETDSILIDDANSVLPASISSSYAPGTAVAYSHKWCGQSTAGSSSSMNPNNYNPLYYYYSGADCCNFVSQCLKAGGMSTGGTWTVTTNSSNVVTQDKNYTKSGEAWRYVPSFETYWVGKGHVKKQITSSSQAVAGNVIYYLKSDGYSSDHIMFIVGVNGNGQVLINGHNNDAYRYPITLSSKKYYTIEFTHCYTNVKSHTSTQHTVSCSLCNSQKVEAHTYTMYPGGRICTVCEYKKSN